METKIGAVVHNAENRTGFTRAIGRMKTMITVIIGIYNSKTEEELCCLSGEVQRKWVGKKGRERTFDHPLHFDFPRI